jgi:hypothetical protein
MLKTLLPESLPEKVKICFLEERKREWAIILKMSEDATKNEKLPESVNHWKQINFDALQRIRVIDEELRLLTGFSR